MKSSISVLILRTTSFENDQHLFGRPKTVLPPFWLLTWDLRRIEKKLVNKTRKRNIEMEMCWEEREVYWEVRMTWLI
jgi:hypothetical protein